MLLDPLEEQLDLPAAPIKLGDRERRQCGVVGEKHKRLALGGPEPNATQRRWVTRLGVEHGEDDRLIADELPRSIHCSGVSPLGLEIGFRTSDEEGPGEVQSVQAFEIEITAVHHVEGTRFGQQYVQHVDVVQFPVGDVDEARDIAAQIDQRVQLDRSLGRAKRCPREQPAFRKVGVSEVAITPPYAPSQHSVTGRWFCTPDVLKIAAKGLHRRCMNKSGHFRSVSS